jgi:DinB superfamily
MDIDIDWNAELRSQLEWHWDNQLRPRLDGLTDEEYFWEPAPGCWSLRPRGQAATEKAAGGGALVLEYQYPPPRPEPLTTIAWRLAHIIVPVLGVRSASHFGGPPADFGTFEYAQTAKDALRQLDDAYAVWIGGVRDLGADGLARPCGQAEGPFAAYPLASLVLHIHREVIHHGAEISLLRDLYSRKGGTGAA